MVKYSFVLPAYKVLFFREAIDSILNQTYTDFELIIVNDASPEDLDSIVNGYDDNRIRYYKNEKNIGGCDLVAQWNKSLSYAKGDYVILASDDDVYFPSYLEKMDELVCKYPEINVFRPRTQLIDSSSNVLYQFKGLAERVNQVEYVYKWMQGDIGSGIGHFIFHRLTLVNQGGFFNLPLAWGSDDATVINLAKSGIGFSPHVMYSFRISGINITSKKNNARTLRLKLQSYKIFEKWLDEMVSQLTIEKEEDKEYLNYIKQNYQNTFMPGLIVDMLKSSSVYAVLINLRYYSQLKCVTLSKGTRWIFKRIAMSFKRH